MAAFTEICDHYTDFSDNSFLMFFDLIPLYNLFQMKPTWCTLLLSIFISISLHVSDNYVPIIRRTYFIYATLVWLAVWSADQTANHTE